jgi:hypothetical protein
VCMWVGWSLGGGRACGAPCIRICIALQVTHHQCMPVWNPASQLVLAVTLACISSWSCVSLCLSKLCQHTALCHLHHLMSIHAESGRMPAHLQGILRACPLAFHHWNFSDERLALPSTTCTQTPSCRDSLTTTPLSPLLLIS